MSRTVTGGTLLTACRRRSDTENDTHIADAEIYEYMSNWLAELHELLIGSGLAYAEKTKTIVSTGANKYPLGSDVLSIIRVDHVASADDVRPVVEIDVRDIHRVSRTHQERALFFRHVQDNLHLYPPPLSGQVYEVIYWPVAATLTTMTDVVDGISGWEDFIVTGAVMDILAKQSRLEEWGVQDKRMNDRATGLRARIQKAALQRGMGQTRSLIQRSPQAEDFLQWEDELWWAG